MKNNTCPYCDCSRLSRYGKVKNIQRYKCKQCERTFRETSGTPLFRLHKVEKVDKYIKALREGMSIRKAARYVGISINTSFVWRHKFLSSLKPKEAVDCNRSDANVQIITMEYSAKGRQNEPEKNRKPTKTLITCREGQLCLYKLDANTPAKNAKEILKNANIPNYVVGTQHKLLNSTINYLGNGKKVQVSNVIKQSKNELLNHLLALTEWMDRFRGVASKYLQHYWSWYLTLNNLKYIKRDDELFSLRCCSERNLQAFFHLIKQ